MRQNELLILQRIRISSALAKSSRIVSTAYEAGRLRTYITVLQIFVENFCCDNTDKLNTITVKHISWLPVHHIDEIASHY